MVRDDGVDDGLRDVWLVLLSLLMLLLLLLSDFGCCCCCYCDAGATVKLWGSGTRE